ncbi:MAG: hypothetical protein ACLUDF_05610 [Butyricicoccus sp.]
MACTKLDELPVRSDRPALPGNGDWRFRRPYLAKHAGMKIMERSRRTSSRATSRRRIPQAPTCDGDRLLD